MPVRLSIMNEIPAQYKPENGLLQGTIDAWVCGYTYVTQDKETPYTWLTKVNDYFLVYS